MDATTRFDRRGGLLYPMLLIAAIALIVFSILGVAMLTGAMPRALSAPATDAGNASADAAARGPDKSLHAGRADAAATDRTLADGEDRGHGEARRSAAAPQTR